MAKPMTKRGTKRSGKPNANPSAKPAINPKGKSSPPPTAQELEDLANLYKLGHYDRAKTAAQIMLAADPKNDHALNILGAIYLATGAHEDAVVALKEAAAANPKNVGAINNLGMAQRKCGRNEQAIASFRQVIAQNPNYTVAKTNRADTLVQENQLEEAVSLYREVLAAQPEHLKVTMKLGSALRELGFAREAMAVYERALEYAPADASIHNNLGNAQVEAGLLDEAMASFRQAIALVAKQSLAYYNLHPLVAKRDDLSESLSCLQSAVKWTPDNLNLRLFLGMVLECMGRSDEAAPHLAMVHLGDENERARLDSWEYLKNKLFPAPHTRCPIPLLRAPIDAFAMALAAAPSDGLILEFGVRSGTSIRHIAQLTSKTVHGFDSFEGLPEAWGSLAAGAYSTHKVLPQVPANVELHVGWFEDTLPTFIEAHCEEKIAMVNIDCDIYSSTRTILEKLAPHFVPGSVIVFDEYIGNLTWRDDEFRAFQEAVTAHSWTYEYLAFSMYTKQVIVRLT